MSRIHASRQGWMMTENLAPESVLTYAMVMKAHRVIGDLSAERTSAIITATWEIRTPSHASQIIRGVRMGLETYPSCFPRRPHTKC